MSRTPVPRPEPAWPGLPPVQRTLAEPLEPVAPVDTFARSLAAHRDPSFLAPLGHLVNADAGGLVDGLADLAPGQPQHYAMRNELSVPAAAHPEPKPQLRVQRHAVSGESPEVTEAEVAEPDAEPSHEPEAERPVQRSLRSVPEAAPRMPGMPSLPLPDLPVVSAPVDTPRVMADISAALGVVDVALPAESATSDTVLHQPDSGPASAPLSGFAEAIGALNTGSDLPEVAVPEPVAGTESASTSTSTATSAGGGWSAVPLVQRSAAASATMPVSADPTTGSPGGDRADLPTLPVVARSVEAAASWRPSTRGASTAVRGDWGRQQAMPSVGLLSPAPPLITPATPAAAPAEVVQRLDYLPAALPPSASASALASVSGGGPGVQRSAVVQGSAVAAARADSTGGSPVVPFAEAAPSAAPPDLARQQMSPASVPVPGPSGSNTWVQRTLSAPAGPAPAATASAPTTAPTTAPTMATTTAPPPVGPHSEVAKTATPSDDASGFPVDTSGEAVPTQAWTEVELPRASDPPLQRQAVGGLPTHGRTSPQPAGAPAASAAGMSQPTSPSVVVAPPVVLRQRATEGGGFAFGPASAGTASFANMFAAGNAAEPTPVQLQAADAPASSPAESSPAPDPAEPAPSSSPAPSAPAPAGGGGPSARDLDEMARRLYEPISARIRAELWLDRERSGVLM